MFARNKHGALLKGLLHCAPCGVKMGHTYATKSGKRIYRYYVCYKAQKQGWDSCPCRSLPAEQIEGFVVEQIKRIGHEPALRSLTLEKLREQLETQTLAAQLELSTVERELGQKHTELARVASDAATNPHATARLADLHAKTQILDERASALKQQVSEAEAAAVTKNEVDTALAEFDGVWETLSPNEKARLLRMLVQRVDYDAQMGSVAITFHPLGLRSIGQARVEEAAA